MGSWLLSTFLEPMDFSHELRNRHILVSASYGGGTVPKENVTCAADFLLMHGNGVKDPKRIGEVVRRARAVPG